MSDSHEPRFTLPPEQQAIRDKCFHPSGTFVEFPIEEVETSIPARFEKIARLYANRSAVITKAAQLTYDDLNRTANRIARAILAREANGQVPVALFLEHGMWPIVAHLAVLKAGKMSLQLDPSARSDRLTSLLQDSQPTVIVTNNKNVFTVRQWENSKARLINVDELDRGLSEQNLALAIDANSYAYLRYTSGSTGSSKGALKTHRNDLHAVMNLTNDFHVCANDRILLLGRDTLGKHVFEGLLNGATICPYDLKVNGLAGIAERIVEEGITICKFFPTGFRNFVESLSGREQFDTLRLIRLEGEIVYARDVDRYKKFYAPGCLLVNSYSSTETGTVSIYLMDQDSSISGSTVPVGYPVMGKEVSILDENGRELGPGQCGEIVVKSSFLSAGYWQRPELTLQKFRAKTNSDDARYYHTGDCGRMSKDGCLEYLGRIDSQVKVRGFRVDVGEVESVLAGHPDLTSAAVAARPNPAAETQLIAYISPAASRSPTVSSLRQFLLERLPDYMVPAVFETVETLPLTATGKIDRRALPEPGKQRPDLAEPLAAPRTPAEQKLAKIWGEVLGFDQVGIHDNFFDLGGHSLAATRIVSLVLKQFQLEIPLRSLFESPTIAQMGEVIAEYQGKQIDVGELDHLLTDIETMTEGEAQKLLALSEKRKSS